MTHKPRIKNIPTYKKSIKIRFIYNQNRFYTIQYSGWFGWRTISTNFGLDYNDVNKEKLLETVLDEVFFVDKKHIEVIEYPTINKY